MDTGLGQEGYSIIGQGRIDEILSQKSSDRREVFEEIGYFDEAHFAYLEDIDIGYRARLFGYDNVYCPEALVRHVGSGTSGSKYNSFKVRLAARNQIYLLYKNMPLWQLMANGPFLAAGIAVKYLFFKKLGFEKEYRQGLFEGLKTAKSLQKTPVFPGRFKRELAIQMELIAGTVIYIYELSRRKLC